MSTQTLSLQGTRTLIEWAVYQVDVNGDPVGRAYNIVPTRSIAREERRLLQEEAPTNTYKVFRRLIQETSIR